MASDSTVSKGVYTRLVAWLALGNRVLSAAAVIASTCVVIFFDGERELRAQVMVLSPASASVDGV